MFLTGLAWMRIWFCVPDGDASEFVRTKDRVREFKFRE